jgi:hypothetical protein
MHLQGSTSGNRGNMQVLSMKPGDYALGSSQSRAAARTLLEQKKGMQKSLVIILGDLTLKEPHATD